MLVHHPDGDQVDQATVLDELTVVEVPICRHRSILPGDARLHSSRVASRVSSAWSRGVPPSAWICAATVAAPGGGAQGEHRGQDRRALVARDRPGPHVRLDERLGAGAARTQDGVGQIVEQRAGAGVGPADQADPPGGGVEPEPGGRGRAVPDPVGELVGDHDPAYHGRGLRDGRTEPRLHGQVGRRRRHRRGLELARSGWTNRRRL